MHYEDGVYYGAEIHPADFSGGVLWPEAENSAMSLLSVHKW